MSILLIVLILVVSSESRSISLTVPPVKPDYEDQYLCHALNLKNDTFFITGFKPIANASHAHHILVYSCIEPGSTESVWTCNEMNDQKSSPVCKSGMKLIYSWAMNAPGLQLPKDVSVMIGKLTGSPYLVLQNHYKNVDYFKNPNADLDQSGIILQVQNKPTEKLAGLYLLVTDGYIPANSTVFMEAACSYNGKVALHPFAFRTHTHKLGKLVSGYVIHNNKWEEIGKKSPQLEQMFYPVNKDLLIEPGDTLASRCIMVNNGTKKINIGPTRKDEMCNFYIYYWVKRADSAQIYDAENQICFTGGWPEFKWDSMIDPLGIPTAAAIMPGETKIIKEMFNEMKQEEREFEKLMSNIFETDNENDFSSKRFSDDDGFDDFQDADEIF